MSKYKTKYGVIRVTDPGPRFRYDNIQTYAQTASRHVVLQGPALRAFKAAEARIATKRRKHLLITGSGYRDWYTQYDLWRSDTSRYANPNGSMHVEALAVDVDQGQGAGRLAAIHKALLAEDWHQAVSGEPWHYSYHVSG